MPETPRLTTIKQLQSDFNAAYDRRDIPAAETLKARIEQEAAAIRATLDPTRGAENIMGSENVISLEEIKNIKDKNGVPVFDVSAPERARFTKEDLERAKETGEQLYYVPSAFTPDIVRKHNFPDAHITMERLHTVFPKARDDKKLLFDTDWYINEEFFKQEKPRAGWRLTSKDLLPNSTSKNYLEQTDLLIEHLTKNVYKNRPLPQHYADAFAEYATKKDDIASLMTGDRWQDASRMLSELALTKLLRETPIEVLMRFVLNSYAKNNKPLPSTYTWTSGHSSDGYLVGVGGFDDGGAYVDGGDPGTTDSNLGVCLSRS